MTYANFAQAGNDAPRNMCCSPTLRIGDGARSVREIMLILLVEDEPISAWSTTCELEQAGHLVIGPAATSDDALRLAHKFHPDLALVDIDLQQGGEGVELARELRDMDIASVFVSAQSGVAVENSELALGLIGKPYNPADMPRSVEVIDAVMHGVEPPTPSPSSLHLFDKGKKQPAQRRTA